jgi:hypothetical protein
VLRAAPGEERMAAAAVDKLVTRGNLPQVRVIDPLAASATP